MTPNTSIIIFGAGAIGCYVGADWARAGASITFLGRDPLRRLASSGLTCSNGVTFSTEAFRTNPKLAFSPSVLQSADLIVLTVKSTALPQAIDDIAKHARVDTPILCLLNGIAPIRQLRTAFPDRTIIAGMVPFNVVWDGDNRLNRSSVGDVTLERCSETIALQDLLKNAKDPVQLSDKISAVQHGKLLLNLNNPINALSGLTLFHQLRQRSYRRAYAAVLEESLNVFDAAGIEHAQSGPLPARKIVKMLRLPNWLFNTFVLPRQKLDPTAQTSMAQDLAAGKPTEIDTINGEILHIAQTAGITAPINSKVVQLIKHAEKEGATPYSGDALLSALNL